MPFKIAGAAASSRRRSEDRLAVRRILDDLAVVVADGAGGSPARTSLVGVPARVTQRDVPFVSRNESPSITSAPTLAIWS